MSKFSLCIEPVLTDMEFTERIKVAADLGFDAIEFWDPAGKDIKKIAAEAANNNIEIAICCVKNAWDIRTNQDIEKVKANFVESVAIAKELGSKSLICLSGELEGKADSQKNILIENLKRLAEIAEKNDITLCVEALNSLVDHKGYYLDSSAIGFEIIKSVGSSHIKLLYDVYHMQIMEGNIIENISKNINSIGHFHSAGVPGRHEHFNGESDYVNILKTIDKTSYSRFFGLEYWPTYENKKSLSDCLAYLKGTAK